MTLLNDFEIIMGCFNGLIAEMPPVAKIKDKLSEIKTFASNASALSSRQKEAIVARVDNYLNGSYGNTKKGIEFKS